MTTAPASNDTSISHRSPWQWPLGGDHYDRTPTLTPAEQTALQALGRELQRGCPDPRRPAWAPLERLVRPLEAARAHLFLPTRRQLHRNSRQAIGRILAARATTQQALWALSPTTWIDVFGT